jgi:hypothetical protein
LKELKVLGEEGTDLVVSIRKGKDFFYKEGEEERENGMKILEALVDKCLVFVKDLVATTVAAAVPPRAQTPEEKRAAWVAIRSRSQGLASFIILSSLLLFLS